VTDTGTNDITPTYGVAEVAREDWPLLVLFALALAAAAWTYPTLPERVPVHWNVHGEVDGWGGRAFGAFGLLGILLGTYAVVVALPLLDPHRTNYVKFLPTFRIIRWSLAILLIGTWAVTLMAARGVPIRVDVVVPVGISLLFIVLGNEMGRLRRNWFIGIRTPWSLANDEAWRLTHRASGPAWVVAGLIMLATALGGGRVASAGMFAGAIGAATFSLVYSYVAYRRSLKAGAPGR
jgi:uncharacterized membrane protein